MLTGMTDFDDATALDLFSGTGSISLELLSRGCRQVVSVELDRDHHAFIRRCLKTLGEENCIALRGDVFRFIKTCHQQFDFIFADPPYTLERLAEIPGLVLSSGMLKDGGIFVFEHGGKDDFSALQHFVGRRSYGSVNFSIFRKDAPDKLPHE